MILTYLDIHCHKWLKTISTYFQTEGIKKQFSMVQPCFTPLKPARKGDPFWKPSFSFRFHDSGTFTNGLDGNTIATPGTGKLFLKQMLAKEISTHYHPKIQHSTAKSPFSTSNIYICVCVCVCVWNGGFFSALLGFLEGILESKDSRTELPQ